MEYLEGGYSATIFQGVGVQGGGVHDFVNIGWDDKLYTNISTLVPNSKLESNEIGKCLELPWFTW